MNNKVNWKRIAIAVNFWVFVLAGVSLGRPVSFEGGWTLYESLDADSIALLAHYSPRQDFSLGLRSEYMRDKKWVFGGIQLNNLLKRWNFSDAQMNFLKSACG